jgi:hypothetical protein
MHPNIPFRIVLDIFSRLSVPDQICFSLCSKYRFFAIF